MFFEGSEKKAEIIIDTGKLNLLADFSDDFWACLVEHCDAKIISRVSNEDVKAFILSESSLFVWHDRLMIITCGQSRLVKGVEHFFSQVDNTLIVQLIYQRKNEYIATAQSSSFIDDVKLLNNRQPGIAYRFGELYGHHNYLYHLDNDHQSGSDEKSSELLAYQISDEASKHLTARDLTAADIRHFLQLDLLAPGFTISDHVFSPFGYSLNAIKGDRYLTIHITPQSASSYVSFDSNIDLLAKTEHILAILAPACFDLVCFNESQFGEKVVRLTEQGYVSKALVSKKLNTGSEVCFASYAQVTSKCGFSEI